MYYLSQDYFERYDGSFMNYLSLLSVHETSHQWWFGIVANDQANEPWLDESLATYSEYLFVEQYYPDLRDWWWQYRVEYYYPSGKVDMTIYDQDELRPYINAVYLRGATFLHQLRQSIGDDAFFSDLILYTETFRGQIVEASDFFAVFIPSATDDTNTLLQKYFK